MVNPDTPWHLSPRDGFVSMDPKDNMLIEIERIVRDHSRDEQIVARVRTAVEFALAGWTLGEGDPQESTFEE